MAGTVSRHCSKECILAGGGKMKRKRVGLAWLTALGMVAFVRIDAANADLAPVMGEVVLTGLVQPAYIYAHAYVYANGKSATPEGERLQLPPGTYDIQVERETFKGVDASVVRVVVEAGRRVEAPLAFRPVYSGFTTLLQPAGPRGPVGPPGPAMAAPRLTPYPAAEAIQAIADATRNNVLDLKGRLERLQAELSASNAIAYYCFDACRVVSGPPGPPGLPGLPGPPPAPFDVSHKITDAKGRSLLTEAAQQLALPQLDAAIAELEKRAESQGAKARPAVETPASSKITILTGALLTELKKRKQQAEAFEQRFNSGLDVFGCVPGPAGPVGPRGPRGPASAVNGPPIPESRLTTEQTEQLLQRLRDDDGLRALLTVVEAEIIRLESVLKR